MTPEERAETDVDLEAGIFTAEERAAVRRDIAAAIRAAVNDALEKAKAETKIHTDKALGFTDDQIALLKRVDAKIQWNIDALKEPT